MRTLISLAVVLLAAGVLTAWAFASSSSVARIADTSTSYAEFSAKVPNLQEVLRSP